MHTVEWRHMAGPSLYGSNTLQKQRPLSTKLPPARCLRIFRNYQYGLAGVPVLPAADNRSDRLVGADGDVLLIQTADKLTGRLWPEMAAYMAQILRVVYTLENKDMDSCANCYGCISGHDWEEDPWTMYVWGASPESLAEGWIHESAHLAMHGMGIHMESWDDQLILNQPDEVYESPVRKDKLRPAGAVLQGLYSYVHVVDWEHRLALAGHRSIRDHLKINCGRLEEGLQTVNHNLRFTEEGHQFWLGLSEWIVTLLEMKI